MGKTTAGTWIVQPDHYVIKISSRVRVVGAATRIVVECLSDSENGALSETREMQVPPKLGKTNH